MIPISKISIFVFCLLVVSCDHKSKSAPQISKDSFYSAEKKTPLIPKDSSHLAEKLNTLFVFVGEKIDVKFLPHEDGSMDNSFVAKYKILQSVYGDYPEDSIEFKVYDHYGPPEFAEYKNVLLFLSKFKGKWYHEKYMFNPVFRTKNGRWAGPYDQYDYLHDFNKHINVKPEIIPFDSKVIFPIHRIDVNGNNYSVTYPRPYYKIIGDTAYAVYGNYVEDLFRLKKNGVLTARKLFGDDTSSEILTQDVELVNDSSSFEK